MTKSADSVILTAENGKKFLVQKDLLCNYSPYFEVALKGPWKESRKGSVRSLSVNADDLHG